METIESKAYQQKDGLDKQMKPLILKWLCETFGSGNFPHAFTDQWITWSIWDGELTIGFDRRQLTHVELFSRIPDRFKGVPQNCTLKIVNGHNFYMSVRHLGTIQYPKILSSKLIKAHTSKDDDGDTCYSSYWEVFLSDETSIIYHNQEQKMDLDWRGFIYDKIIQERFFVNFLLKHYAQTHRL